MLTVKSHIPNTQRGGKQAVWAPCEGDGPWHSLWGGGPLAREDVFQGFAGSEPLRREVMLLALWGSSVSSCPGILYSTQVLPHLFSHPSIHPSNNAF